MQRQARWQAQGAQELERSGQLGLFDEPQTSTHLDDLKTRYRSMMVAEAEEFLKSQKKVLYNDLELRALTWPLMNSQELKDWIKKEANRGRLEIEGLGSRESAPKHDRDHHIVWRPTLW